MSWLSRLTASRRPHEQSGAGVEAFWAWWAGGGAVETAAAIADHEPDRVAATMTSKVHAMDVALAWELSPGVSARHTLVVTSGGDPRFRGLVRRWLMAAPPSDELWTYADSRQASPEAAEVVLTFADALIDVASVTVHAQVAGSRVNVGVYHPGFAALAEADRRQVTYLLLDLVLGESDVEIWVGTVVAMTAPALDPVPIAGLPAVIEHLRDEYLDADGEPTWVLMRGHGPDGALVMASAQAPLRAATAPHLDTYVGIGVPFSDLTAESMPGPGSLQALRDFEDHLQARLGPSGRLVAHETRRGVRLFHFYVDGTTPAAEQLRTAASGWSQGRIQIASAADPSWNTVGHLAG